MFSLCELRALRLLTSVRLINGEKRYSGTQPEIHLNAIRYDRKARLQQVTANSNNNPRHESQTEKLVIINTHILLGLQLQ